MAGTIAQVLLGGDRMCRSRLSPERGEIWLRGAPGPLRPVHCRTLPRPNHRRVRRRAGLNGEHKTTDLNSVPRLDGRVWGPDLFAWAYDALDASHQWKGHPDSRVVEHRQRVVIWRDALRKEAGWVPERLLSEITDGVADESTESQTLLEVLVALDRAYRGIRISRPAFLPQATAVAALRARWTEDGLLQRAAEGYVLRKGSHWFAGSSLAHYFDDLARVDPGNAHLLSVVIDDTPASLGSLARSQYETLELKIAFVPTLDDPGDIEFLAAGSAGQPRFRVELNNAKQIALQELADRLIAALEADGVNVAVFPETTCDSPSVEALRVALITNAARAAAQRRLQALRLVVVGCAGDGTNSAIALRGDGRILFEQAKTQRWRMSLAEQDRYGLVGSFQRIERSEDIVEATRINLLDAAGFGRVAVLICEDLIHGDGARRLMISATTTIVLSPVLDGGLSKDRWAYRGALNLADEPGALVVVANSLVLELRARAQSKSAHLATTEVGIGIICHPTEHHQTGITTAGAGTLFESRAVSWLQATV